MNPLVHMIVLTPHFLLVESLSSTENLSLFEMLYSKSIRLMQTQCLQTQCPQKIYCL